MRSLRFVFVSWKLQFKMIMRSPFDGIGNVIYPLFFATTAFFVFRAGSSPRTLVYASLGAAVMGMWSSVSTSAGSAMQRERWWGTLELLVAAPRHFSLILFPSTLGLATVGIYNLTATLLWGRFAFGIPLTIEHPLLFGLSVVGTVLAFAGLGLLFAVSFVRFRAAWVLGNFFEYPVWLICGFLVPLSLLPQWVRPISWVLAPTWGMNAIRESALGGTPLRGVDEPQARAGQGRDQDDEEERRQGARGQVHAEDQRAREQCERGYERAVQHHRQRPSEEERYARCRADQDRAERVLEALAADRLRHREQARDRGVLQGVSDQVELVRLQARGAPDIGEQQDLEERRDQHRRDVDPRRQPVEERPEAGDPADEEDAGRDDHVSEREPRARAS